MLFQGLKLTWFEENDCFQAGKLCRIYVHLPANLVVNYIEKNVNDSMEQKLWE
jgi:hypothetical protein